MLNNVKYYLAFYLKISIYIEIKISNQIPRLRHTFPTRALELGFDAKTLSEILGHSSVTTTLNLYAHVLPEHKKKEMEKLNDLYKNSSE